MQLRIVIKCKKRWHWTCDLQNSPAVILKNNVGILSDLFVEINSPDIAVADEVLTDMPGPVFVGPKPSLLFGVKFSRSKSEWTGQMSSFVHS